MKFARHFIEARYWRAVIIGVTTTPETSWRVFALLFVNILLIVVFITNALLEPDPNHWRVHAAWSIALLLILFLPLNIVSIKNYKNRHKIDIDDIDVKYRKVPDLGKEFRIGLVAVIAGPPIIHYILGLFDLDLAD